MQAFNNETGTYTELVEPIPSKLAGEEDNLIVGNLTVVHDRYAYSPR